MPDTPVLRPATEEEIADSIAFGLRFDGRKRVHHADTIMARITAERLVRHLQASGFVLMRRPAAAMPSTSHHGPPRGSTGGPTSRDGSDP